METEKEILCSMSFDLNIELPYRWILVFINAIQGLI